MKKAREAKKRLDEERIRKEREERERTTLPKKEEAIVTEPVPEKPMEAVPMEIEKPVPVKEDPPQETIQPPTPPKTKEPIQYQDLFIIPPSFSWQPDHLKEKQVAEEDMKNVHTTHVPVKHPPRPNAYPTNSSKKRPREESSSEEEESSSEEQPTQRAKLPNHSGTKPSMGTVNPIPPAKQTSYLETIGGYARKGLAMANVDTSKFAQNTFFFLGSIALMLVQSKVQERFARGVPIQPNQGVLAHPPSMQPQQQQLPSPTQNFVNPPVPSQVFSNQWSNYAR